MADGIGQPQLDALFSAALAAAIGRIEKDGHFFPLLFELRANGAIQNVAVLETGSFGGAGSVLDRLAAILRPRIAEDIVRAAAIAFHGADRDEIVIRLRAPNYSADILVPFELETSGFVRRRRKAVLGEFTERSAANELF